LSKRWSTTPAGAEYHGYNLTAPVCGVSIMRAGDSMEFQLRQILPNAPIGKILIQRDKKTHLPTFFFANLPPDIADRKVLLLDPMLATGGTAVEAISTLLEHGVLPENIILVTILSVAEGLNAVHKAFPEVRVVTSSIEERLNEDAFMLPGIGDFGDRYFGTYVVPEKVEGDV
jgi:uracil phosphoribosyltransferase